MNDSTFWMEMWKMLTPDQLDRLIKTQGHLKDRNAGTLSRPRPELHRPATAQPSGPYSGPIQ